MEQKKFKKNNKNQETDGCSEVDECENSKIYRECRDLVRECEIHKTQIVLRELDYCNDGKTSERD